MIACQDKWHLSTLAELHIHLRLESSHAYTGEKEREVITGLVSGGQPIVDFEWLTHFICGQHVMETDHVKVC